MFVQSSIKKYKLDFDKINTVEDIKKVLMALHVEVYEDYQYFDELKPYLVEEKNNRTGDDLEKR